MTTPSIPADQVRPIVAAMRAAMRRDEHEYSDAEFLTDMSDYIRALEALLAAPPTQWALYWRNGERQIVEGPDAATAMNCAGIGAGALAALDFHKKGAEDHGYRWSADDRRWIKEENENE